MPKKSNDGAAYQDPVRFATDVLKVKLWDIQKRVLHAVARERRVAIKGGHASSKTHSAAIAAIHFAVKHRNARVIILAPGWLTVRSVLWSQIHSLLAGARYSLPTTTLNQTEIRIGVDNLVIGLSARESGRLSGHHAEHVLIIADEATAIEPSFWPAVEGNLAGGDTHLLLLGNPVVASGYFYDAFAQNRVAWTTFSISAFDTPNLAGLTLEQLLELPDRELDKNVAPYLATRRWVKERYKEWWNGSLENSPLWAARVLGEFPSAASNALIPLPWLEASQRAPFDSGADVIIGIDVAGPGKDATAAVACSGSAILAAQTWTDSDARGAVLAFCKQFDARLRLVRVDSAGIGFYFCEHIRSAGYRTEGINVASAPADKERFANSKAERYWMLRERFQCGEISGLTDEMLAELATITWLLDSHGRTVIESKEGVKAILGHSPDLAEALMIAIGEGKPEPMAWIPAIRHDRPFSFSHTPNRVPGARMTEKEKEYAKRSQGGFLPGRRLGSRNFSGF